jgi:hypothetical protein
LFFTVTDKTALFRPIASLPKASEVGLAVTAAIPVPLSVTLWGLLLALSVIFKLPLRTPRVLGLKVMEMVQVLPATRVEGLMGQLLVWV